MYGTRDAAVNWHHEYVAALESFGMKRGAASPCLFSHGGLSLSVFVHGDDFVAVGPGDSVKKLEGFLKQRYNVKSQIMGPDAGDEQELKIPNRIVRYGEKEVSIEADPRHSEIIIREIWLTGQRGSRVPGSKIEAKKSIGKEAKQENEEEDEAEPEYLGPEEARRFRALTARLNYI